MIVMKMSITLFIPYYSAYYVHQYRFLTPKSLYTPSVKRSAETPKKFSEFGNQSQVPSKIIIVDSV